jgi:rod shape-determining protein MreD|tara:strand:+ start:215 stop:727 length:513 start_codon:yes stop_codon:yes gene_type:complete
MNLISKYKLQILKSLPLIIFYFLIFNSFDGLREIETLNNFSFKLQMIIIYFYVLKFPDQLGLGHVFLGGILNDIILGTPMGTSSLSFLILAFFTSYMKNVTLRSKMSAEWFTFIPALFFSNLVYFIIVNNFSNLSFYYLELLRSSFFTFLFFPIFYYLFNNYQKLISKRE